MMNHIGENNEKTFIDVGNLGLTTTMPSMIDDLRVFIPLPSPTDRRRLHKISMDKDASSIPCSEQD